jgi:hypothetical protein
MVGRGQAPSEQVHVIGVDVFVECMIGRGQAPSCLLLISRVNAWLENYALGMQ